MQLDNIILFINHINKDIWSVSNFRWQLAALSVLRCLPFSTIPLTLHCYSNITSPNSSHF